MLIDERGRYLLERRPASARVAAGQLTCFGGGREQGEHPDACIRRELREELGFVTDDLELFMRLTGKGGRVIAWIYRGPAPREDSIVHEPGFASVWLTRDELRDANLARWHRAIFDAMLRGEDEAVVGE
jgi:8-oxo-dGTP pyrophosphatase MutT (NUDIX family)